MCSLGWGAFLEIASQPGTEGIIKTVHEPQCRLPQRVSRALQQPRAWLEKLLLSSLTTFWCNFCEGWLLIHVEARRPVHFACFCDSLLGWGAVMVAANGFSSDICWHSVKYIYQYSPAHLYTCNPFCFVLHSNLLADTHALKMINGKVAYFSGCTQMSLWKIFNGLSVAFHVTTCQVPRNSRVSP